MKVMICFHGSICRKKKKRDGFWKGLELECKGMMGMFFRLREVLKSHLSSVLAASFKLAF
jgi:hypothetical protein